MERERSTVHLKAESWQEPGASGELQNNLQYTRDTMITLGTWDLESFGKCNYGHSVSKYTFLGHFLHDTVQFLLLKI